MHMEITVRSSEGGTFDCYLATPDADGRVPAIVLASAVHGVDGDIRRIADEFSSYGYIAAAPTCSGVRCPVRCRVGTGARRSAHSRGSRKYAEVKPTWSTSWPSYVGTRYSMGARR